MRAHALTILILVAPGIADAQVLDLAQHRFTDHIRVLAASEYLPRETIRSLQQAGAPLPGPVAVGSLNRVTYFYRANAVGLFATEPNANWQRMSRANSWAVECTRDAMDDSLTCRLSRGDLVLVVPDTNKVIVLVGRNHYPGSDVAIRVDDHAPTRGGAPGFSGSQASEIVGHLVQGTSVITRFQEWPYQSNVDKTLSLYGFKEAFSFLHWLRRAVGETP